MFCPAGGAAQRVWEATLSSRLAKLAWQHAHKQKQCMWEHPSQFQHPLPSVVFPVAKCLAEFFDFIVATRTTTLSWGPRHPRACATGRCAINLNYVTWVIISHSMKCYLNGYRTASRLWSKEHLHWLTWKPCSPPSPPLAFHLYRWAVI